MEQQSTDEGADTAPRTPAGGGEVPGGRPGPRIEGYDPALLASFSFAHEHGLDHHLGLQFDLVSPERLEAHLDVTDDHRQPYGLVHGGVHAAIVESVGSIASVLRVLADGRRAVGVTNSTDFLRPVTAGRLHAVGTPIHVGRTQHLWLVEIRDDRGRLAARGQLRTAIIDGPD